MAGGVLIIGIGNRLRGDDALGPLASDILREEGFNAIEHSGEPAGLIELWKEAGHVILIDAVFSGDAPGTVHHFDLTEEKLPACFARPSSHAVGVAEAVEFSRVLGKLPEKIEFFGVEGESYGYNEAMAGHVEESMGKVIEEIRGCLYRR